MTTTPRPPCRIVKTAWLARLALEPRRMPELRTACLSALTAIDNDDVRALVLALEDIAEETAGETRRLAKDAADAVRRAMEEQRAAESAPRGCCGEYETGSGEHGDECEHAA